MRATARTTKFAMKVKPFLKDINLSLLCVLYVKELTIDMLDIWTLAQPIVFLKVISKTYQH